MIRLLTLGTASITCGATQITPEHPRKFALLLYLAAERGRRIGRTLLQDLVYPDLVDKNAQHSLRELVYQVRRAGVPLSSSKTGVELAAADVSTDYDDLIESARPTLEQLHAAEGGFLPSYSPEQSEAFTEWLSAFRARTTMGLVRTLLKELSRVRSVSNWLAAERAARACLAIAPLNEEATLALAEALAMSGAKLQALKILDQYTAEVGQNQADLRLPAAVVRRRISERMREGYRAPLTLPFLGRDKEMAALNERLELARGGESQCVVLVGDAGIGKTRLAEELCGQAMLAGARVEHVVTQPHDVHRPMATFADLVPRLLELPGALGCSPASMAALKRLTTVDVAEGKRPSDANSEAVASAIVRAIVDLVDAITSETTLVLHVDDIQWMDDDSRRTLAMLVSARHQRRLLAITTSRDRRVGQFFAQAAERALVVPLAPLSDTSSRDLLARVFEAHIVSSDQDFLSWIASTSGGNPFFLRCLIGHYHATSERFVVPTSVSSLLDQQVSSLSANASSLLAMSVALGRHADVDRVIRALEIPYIELQAAIRELEFAHLLVRVDQRFEAAHWLIAEATRRSLPPLSQQLIHRRVATLLELDARRSRSASQLWDCAEQWLLAEDHDRAVEVMQECATHSLEIGKPREAGEVLLRAAALIGGGRCVRLLSRAIAIADSAGELDVVIRGCELAESLGVRLEEPQVQLAEMIARLSIADHVPADLERVRTWLRANESPAHRLRAAFAILLYAEHTGEPALAEEAYEITKNDVPVAEQRNLTLLVISLVYHSSFGLMDESCRIADRLLSLADQPAPFTTADIQRKAAIAFRRAGQTQKSLESLHLAYENGARAGLSRLQLLTALLLSVTYRDIGDEDGGRIWLAAADVHAELLPEARLGADYVSAVTETAFLEDKPAVAQRWIEAANADRVGHFAKSQRAKRWAAAVQAWVDHRPRDASNIRRTVADLTQHHIRGRENGDLGDFELAVSLRLLHSIGDVEQARELLSNYLREFRRSRAPLSRTLQVSIELLTAEASRR
jgi:DNA-binding SARP family transcriptional activator